VKIQVLGTCACDYSDKLKNEFRDKFDNDARRSSAVLINDHVLIDCGEHILESLDILNIPYAQITDILITHTHDDHFNPQNIEKIAKNRHTPLNLWVRKDAKIPEIFGITLKRLSPYCKVELEKDAYITSLIANHDPSTFPQHFLLEIYGKKMFYGCDGAWLLTQTYNYLSNTNLDLMVFDATVGDYIGDYRLAEHNSIPMIRLMIPSLKVNGTINDKTKIIINKLIFFISFSF
jgi:phosphoribosyl 1,2-cyclic phosphate phosphodiesterase